MRRSSSLPRWPWLVAARLRHRALLALATCGLWLGACDTPARRCENCSAGSRDDAGPSPMSTQGAEQPSPTMAAPNPASSDPPDDVGSEPPLSSELYGNCLVSSDVCGAGAEPHCLVDSIDDPTMGFCSSVCDSLGVCPRAPFGGTAPADCIPLGDRGGCVLNCLEGQECPTGMVCLPMGVCGYVTPDAINPYGSCDDCPRDSLGCLNTASGSVCVPSCAESCPSPRNGVADCFNFDADGDGDTDDDRAIGCGLTCDPVGRCPGGMLCDGFSSLCVWPEADPCKNFDCGHDADCSVIDGQAVCSCEPGFVEDNDGDCKDPCEASNCHDTARCEIAANDEPLCVCDEGEVMDLEGRCFLPVTGCPGGHSDGDIYEPNDCLETAAQVAAGEAALGISRVDATIGPLESDLDYWRVADQGGTYWLLLEGEEALCELEQAVLPMTPAFGGFSFGVELRSTALPDSWLCGGATEFAAEPNADTPYSLGLLHFATFGDLPDRVDFADVALLPPDPFESEPDVNVPLAADSFADADDIDAFGLRARLPLVLSFTGQAAEIEVEVFDAMGMVVERSTVSCGFSLEPRPCINLPGSEEATVNLLLRQSPAAEQTTLRAWQLNW